jgi:hypothetical protein
LKTAWAKSSARPYLENLFTKIGLAEWLKLKALSSSPVPYTHTHKNDIKEMAPSLGTPPISGSSTPCYFFYLNKVSCFTKKKILKR